MPNLAATPLKPYLTVLSSSSKPTAGSFTLDPSSEFFGRLSAVLNEQATVIDRVFPADVNVMLPFLERVAEDVVGEYITLILDEAHARNMEMYLKAVAGIYSQCIAFAGTLKPTKGSREVFESDVLDVVNRVFEPHVDLYLQDELEYFRKKSQEEVDKWERKVNSYLKGLDVIWETDRGEHRF